MPIVLYWLAPGEPTPACAHFEDHQLTAVLALAEQRRREGCRHVSISSEMAGHVGRAGVDAVEAGRTPDGQAYGWSKAGRAGRMRRQGSR
jgi:hypothetical protein